MSRWRDMATAPKDGRQILVAWRSLVTDEVVLSTVRWDDDLELFISAKGGGGVVFIRSPTHWTTLPRPPALPDSGDRKVAEDV